MLTADKNKQLKTTKMLKKFNNKKFNDAKTIALRILNIEQNNIDALNILSLINLSSNRAQEAEQLIIKALKKSPTSLELNYTHALILMDVKQFTKSSEILNFLVNNKQDMHKARFYLASCYMALGMFNQAIPHYNYLINANQFAQNSLTNVFNCIKYSLPQKYSQDLERNVLSYLKHKTVDHNSISRYTSMLIKYKYQLENENLTIKLNDIVNDELLKESLRKMILTNDCVEMLLTKIRRTLLLEVLEKENVPTEYLELCISVATQLFNNEYLYTADKNELDSINNLVNQLDEFLNEPSIVVSDLTALIVSIAMYSPLHKIKPHNKLLKIKMALWPEIIQHFMKTTLFDVHLEIQIAENIPVLNPIENKTSLVVKQQYEENPYPRWSNVTYAITEGYAKYLQSELYQFSLPSHLKDKAIKILIAGCGTGKQAIEVAKNYPNAKIYAIDLSKRSLAFAKIKSEQYQINNIEFLNADILDLDRLNFKFNIIECIGVLHHMENPDEGWQKLSQILVKNGIMKIGLYSEVARQQIVKARHIIASEKIECDEENIRLFRLSVMNGLYGEEIRFIANNSKDFFSMSGCRDLFFHVKEHQYTCKKLQNTLNKHNLNFLGFCNIQSNSTSIYKEQFPENPAMNHLLNWEKVEEKAPYSFGEMYQFFCQSC